MEISADKLSKVVKWVGGRSRHLREFLCIRARPPPGLSTRSHLRIEKSGGEEELGHDWLCP